MGRPNTGAWTVYESLRIELPFLRKNRFIERGLVKDFTLTWTDLHGNITGSLTGRSSYLADNIYLEISYWLPDKKKQVSYRIELCEHDSNLGLGRVLYFICPQTRRRCRMLYKAYGSDIFKSRFAYTHRLYYDCQIASKLSKYNDTYWRIASHLKKIHQVSKKGQRKYKGKLTRIAERYSALYQKQALMDRYRWTLGVPKSLRDKIGEI